MDPTRCPYCAEEISPQATLCPHCRSFLGRRDTVAWQRDWPERRVAGVAAAVSRGLGLPLTPVRVAFVVLSFFHLLGALLYGALWLLLPFRTGGESPLEEGLGIARDAVRRFRHTVFDGAPQHATPVETPSSNGVPEEPRA